MMTELWLRLTYWWLTAMLSDSCQPQWLRCQGPPKDLNQLGTSAATSFHTQTCWLSASAGQRGKTSLTACLLMTATVMVDGRKRAQPVALIHGTAAATGWHLAKVSTVVISTSKWHLKCEAVAVLVAQSPRAVPWTWVLNPVPSVAARSQTPEQTLLAQML